MEREQLLANFWQGFSHPVRLKILYLLASAGPQYVSQLVEAIGIGQGHLSNHLACLRNCGLVVTEAHGRFVQYAIKDERVISLLRTGENVVADHIQGIATCPVIQPTIEKNEPKS